MGRSWEAVCALHEALAVAPQDPVATDLLGRALEENASQQGWAGVDDGADQEEDVQFENFIASRKGEVTSRRVKGKGKGRARFSEVGEDSMMVMSDDDEE